MKTKRIVAVIGSPRGTESSCYKVVRRLCEKLRDLNQDIEEKIIQLSEYELGMCKGCTSCFIRCDTCNQYDDGIEQIEKELLDADIVIFASPVYAHSITGTMKNFIDRISYWLHVFKLTGKYGLVVSSSNSNGNRFVDDYLSKMMEFMGISVMGSIDHTNIDPNMEEKIEAAAKNVAFYLENDRTILNYESKNKVFQVYKAAYKNEYDRRVKIPNAPFTKEILYWKEKGFFECDSFQELYDLTTISKG